MQRVYFGWYIVLASFISYALVIGLTTASFGVFVLPVSQEFGLTRSQMNTTLILINIGGALAAPLAGRMLDRLPIRPFILASVIALGLLFVVLSQSRNLWISAMLLILPIPIAMLGASMSSMAVLIARWFKVYLARAMALAILGMSFGTIVVPPAIGWMVEEFGWRMALAYFSLAMTAILFPLMFTVRDRPGPNDSEVPGSKSASVVAATAEIAPQPAMKPTPMLEILTTPAFWTIMLGVSAAMAVNSACIASLTPMATGKGIEPVMAAAMVSMVGAGSVTGILLVAAIGDRIDRITLITGAFFLMGLACLGFMLAESRITLMAAALLLGLCGSSIPAFYALIADRFGAASYGTVQGLMQPMMAIIGAFGMFFAGEIFDRTGGYDLMFLTFFGVQAVAALLIWVTRFTGQKQD